MVKVLCSDCGKGIERPPCRIKRTTNHFCDRKCKARWQQRNNSGEKNHNWKGRTIVKCSYCERDLSLAEWQIKRSKNHFCDNGANSCYSKWLSENMRGERGNGYKGGKRSVLCEYCGKEKFVYPYRLGESIIGFFCGNGCLTKWQSENWRGENNPKWTRKKIICEYCGRRFFRKSSRIGRAIHNFCSRDCASSWRGENWRPEDYPAWRGGRSFKPYPVIFNKKFRKLVRELAGRRCEWCDITEEENGQKLSVHHLTLIKDITDLDWCVALCRWCHLGYGGIHPILRRLTNKWRIKDYRKI